MICRIERVLISPKPYPSVSTGVFNGNYVALHPGSAFIADNFRHAVRADGKTHNILHKRKAAV